VDALIRSLIWLVTLSLTAAVVDLTPQQQQRARKLEQRLVAPCCWSEQVATHRSGIALQMKAEIARLVSEGKPDREIVDLYTQRYGMRILMEPEGARWWWTNVVPLVALALGLALTVVVIRRLLRPIPSSSQ
jgi:cytochrome c-type biogenesis protein CcmH/NrfF